MAKPPKTDMSARITDHKSGVPDRPTDISRGLRREESAYMHDMMGKPTAVKSPESTAKNAELSKLLRREEERLRKIEHNLQRPDLIEQNLREATTRTMNAESEFASSGNIKTDTRMKMTDDPRYAEPLPSAKQKSVPVSPLKQASPSKAAAARQPLTGGGLYTAMNDNVKTDMVAGITDHRSHLDELSKTMQDRVREEESNYARDVKGAPEKKDQEVPKQEALAGVSNVSTKTYAYITDNRSRMRELSGTTRERLREEEDSYLRDMHPHPGMKAELVKPSGTATPKAGAVGETTPQPQAGAMTGGGREIGGTAGGVGTRAGAGAGGSKGGGSAGSARVAPTTTRQKDDDHADSEEYEHEQNVCWLVPERIQRMFSPLKPQRPHRAAGASLPLEMEVDDESFDPYLNQGEAMQTGYQPEEEHVMYRTRSPVPGRRRMYETEQECKIMYQGSLDPSIVYQEMQGGGIVYGGKGSMYDDQQQGIVYQDAQCAAMYMEEPEQRVVYQDPRTVYQQQMVEAMPQVQMTQAIPQQQYAYVTGRPATCMYSPSQNLVTQKGYIKISVSEQDLSQNWTDRYAPGGPNRQPSGVVAGRPQPMTMQQAQGSDATGFRMYMNAQRQYQGQSPGGSMESEGGFFTRDESFGMKTAAVQTMPDLPISTTVQTEISHKETKSVHAKAETDEVATQQNFPKWTVSNSQTFPPYVPGAGMPFMGMGQMASPFMSTRMPVAPPMVHEPPPPPPASSRPCDECDRKKNCCEDVPFEDLQRNIEEDIANIVNENMNVKISNEDTKILVARPDSPYKLVYLIPQRPEIVKEAKSIQTANLPEDKWMQTDAKSRNLSRRSVADGEAAEASCQIEVSKINTKECRVNGKRVRTTKAYRISQSEDKDGMTEVIQDSSSSDRGRSRSKSRSKTMSRRAVSEGKYPQSITISVGRTSSTTERSRSRSCTLSPVRSVVTGPNRSPRQAGKRWKEISISSSYSSASSRTNGSIIGVSSNAGTASTHTSYYCDPSKRPLFRSCSMTNMPPSSTAQSPVRCLVAGGATGMVYEGNKEWRHDYRNKVGTSSSKVYVERAYPEPPDPKYRPECRSPLSTDPNVVLCTDTGAPRRTEVCTRTPEGFTRRITEVYTTRPSDKRTYSPVGGQPPRMSARPRSASSGRRSVTNYEGLQTARVAMGAVGQSSNYQAEQIAKQIAHQLAPQLSAMKQMEPQRYVQEQETIRQPSRSPSASQRTTLQPLPQRAFQNSSRPVYMAESPEDDVYRGGYYTYKATHSQERLLNEQSHKIAKDCKVRYNREAAPSVSQGLLQQSSRQQPARYASHGNNRRMMVQSSMSQTLHPTYQHASLRTNYTPYSKPSTILQPGQAPPRYILPIQLQVTGGSSRGPVSMATFRATVPVPAHAEVMAPSKAINGIAMNQQQQLQQQDAGSTTQMRSIHPDVSPSRAHSPQRCPVDKRKAFYKRAYGLRIPAQEKQVLMYALVSLVALISVILVINTIGKRHAAPVVFAPKPGSELRLP
ncbi:uncharacterized protein LOC115330795 [Ixodes scapularis]|uniref:uncharacterized protein LOC115330795 n=1 Tax=Ixodes scapularis TaxID=6945 RepID=UPI001A9F5635|nr:uncharacterized protein LOC115330795 [Ixodes scapularis]